VRRRELAQYRDGGCRVLRRDDGAERDRRGPGHRGNQGTGHDGDGQHRQADGHEDQAADGRPVVAQVARACVVGRVQQHGRHEQRERHLGIEGRHGCPGHEGEARAGEGQQSGVGHLDALCHQGQDGPDQQ